MTDSVSGAGDPEASPACFFCSVASGAAGVPLLVDGKNVVAFRDIDPKAPTHVLVIPKRHYRDVVALAEAEPAALAELVTVGGQITATGAAAGAAAGPDAGEFRLVFNTGASVGQSVFHAHGHVLAGRPFGWPPG